MRFAFQRDDMGVRVGGSHVQCSEAYVCAKFDDVARVACVDDSEQQFGIFAFGAGVLDYVVYGRLP